MPSVPEPSASESTLEVRYWLDRHKAGDEAALKELLEISMRRLRLLAQHILGDIPAVRQFEETDDLLQNAVVRLWKYLSSHPAANDRRLLSSGSVHDSPRTDRPVSPSLWPQSDTLVRWNQSLINR